MSLSLMENPTSPGVPVTPRKILSEGICLVCKRSDIKKGEIRQIHSDAGIKKQLSCLLLRYGEINIIEGILCRKCERRLLSLDKSVSDFKKDCHENFFLLTSKRCLSDITNTISLTNKRPVSKKSLFPLSDVESEESFSIEKGANSDSGYSSFLNVIDTPIPIRSKQSIISSTPVSVSTPKSLAYHETLEFTGIDFIENLNPSPSLDNSYQAVDQNNNQPFKTALPYIDNSNTSTTTDHNYYENLKDQSSTKEKGTKQSRLSKKHMEVATGLINTKSLNDMLSRGEITDILATLPLLSRQALISTIMKNDELRIEFENALVSKLSEDCDFLKNRKKGKVSSLMDKELKDLKEFNWNEIIKELKSSLPFLLKVFLAVLIPEGLQDDKRQSRTAGNIPRMAMAYAILAQGRNAWLSRVQRILSTVLFDNICDQKVNMCF